jgi:hypothetical protein
MVLSAESGGDMTLGGPHFEVVKLECRLESVDVSEGQLEVGQGVGGNRKCPTHC